MVSLFREKTSGSVFLLLLLSIAIHLPFFAHPPQVLVKDHSGLLAEWMKPLQALPDVLLMLIYQLLVVLQALRLNYTLNESRMFQKQTFTVGMAYILLTSILPEWNNITPALICNSFIIWILHMVVTVTNSASAKSAIFNAGLIAGVSVLLYHPSVSIILFCFIAIAIVRPFELNEWFVLLLGILSPFYFYLSYLFLTDKLGNIRSYLPAWDPHEIKPGKNLPALIATISMLGFLLLLGLYVWRATSSRLLIHVRKNWSLLLFMLIVLTPMVFIAYNTGIEAGVMSMVPLAAFAGNVFLYPRSRWITALLFWAVVGISLYNSGVFNL
ncbi:MAG: hypothetical protein J0I41_21300 [Filimonas sp.]|nr:hypothetical protein [Filimonas sp.]